MADKVDMCNGYSMTMPVMPVKVLENGCHLVGSDINGTCFSIGGAYMITAGHVVATNPASESESLAVGIMGPNGFFKSARVIRVEGLPCDLGLLEVQFVYPDSEHWFHRIKWSERPLQPFEIIRAVGYAYGMHISGNRQSVVVRGFQGHIVSGIDNFQRLGAKEPPFSVYELSFAAPRGLSGAPLFNAGGTVATCGVVIGNSESQMTVFRSEERELENGATRSYERYESLTLGIAVPTEQVLKQPSVLLGMTIREHLERYGLLSRAGKKHVESP